MKTCTKCGELKVLDAYFSERRAPDGRQAQCKVCRVANSTAWRKANADKAAATRAEWQAKNAVRELAIKRAWNVANAARALKKKREWRAANRGRHNATEMRRHAAKLQRVPPWADLDAIRTIYARAALVAEITGEPVHVDHDIPLCGKLVSGLHVHTNLVIRHATENLRKNNRFEVA